MTARQILEEIKNLSRDERAEMWTLLQQEIDAPDQTKIRFLPREEAKEISQKLFADYDGLFRKLAQ